MNFVIPMAGRGTRLRPHTLTVPKPLIPVAGKPIIQRLVEDLSQSYGKKIDQIAYICGEFGQEVERELLQIARNLGAEGKIFYQDKPLGVGHAIHCAWEALRGPTMIAFADTLFKADFSFNHAEDGVIWVQKVKDPSSFGVVRLDADGVITDFVEKPTTFVSDLAIVGIYYFREGEKLRLALHHILQHDIREKGEFQLTTALEMLRQEGLKFKTGSVEEWLDCGNKENILNSNERMLEIHHPENWISPKATIENSVILKPCFIGDGVVLRNCVVGPHVSVGNFSILENTIISSSVVQQKAVIKNALLDSSMIGNASKFLGAKSELNLGDYSNFSRK